MTATATATRVRRSPAERALVGVLVFQGLSAVFGGGMLLAQAGGAGPWFPEEWLAHIPFDGWFWPAMILGVGLGCSALVLAHGVRRTPPWSFLAAWERWTGHHWSWTGSLGLGVGLMAWIVVQLQLIPGTTWLQPFYFAVGPRSSAWR